MPTWLSRLLRRKAPLRVPVTPQGWADFLRAGGTISVTEWSMMDADTHAVLAKAGRIVAIERAAPGLSPWPVNSLDAITRSVR